MTLGPWHVCPPPPLGCGDPGRSGDQTGLPAEVAQRAWDVVPSRKTRTVAPWEESDLHSNLKVTQQLSTNQGDVMYIYI